MNAHDWFFQQTSQALGFLSLLGVIACVVRWKKAIHKDFLLAVAVYLMGAALREVVVYHYSGGWTEVAYVLSGVARIVQLGGAVMFLRVALKEHCSPWAQVALLCAVCAFVGVV